MPGQLLNRSPIERTNERTNGPATHSRGRAPAASARAPAPRHQLIGAPREARRDGSAAPAGPVAWSCPDGGHLFLRELPKKTTTSTYYGRDNAVPAYRYAVGATGLAGGCMWDVCVGSHERANRQPTRVLRCTLSVNLFAGYTRRNRPCICMCSCRLACCLRPA